MNHYKHSGKAGDLVYALMAITYMDKGILYINESTPGLTDEYKSFYDFVRSYCLSQGHITKVLPYIEHKHKHLITHDLDTFRDAPNISKNHLIESYHTMLNIPTQHFNKLKFDIEDRFLYKLRKECVVFNRTQRYRTDLDWHKVIEDAEKKYKKLHFIFVGTWAEYMDFLPYQKKKPIIYFLNISLEKWRFIEPYNIRFRNKIANLPDIINTELINYFDLITLSDIVECAEAVYCNQSVILTLAQRHGIKYYLEQANGHTNTALKTCNETILNC